MWAFRSRSAPAARAVLLTCATCLVVACGAGATPSPGLGTDWGIAVVEQPTGVGAQPSGADIGVYCSPCHSSESTHLLALTPGGPGLVAVGFVFPGTYAAAWTSADGRDWQRVAGFPAPELSSARAVATGPHAVVAVGTVRATGAGWWSTDGRAWQAAQLAPPEGVAATELDAVAALGDGFVAGGSQVRIDGSASAALWSSPDGRAWAAEPIAPGAAGAGIHALASGPSGLVAVGWASIGATTRATAWRSADGRAWTAATVAGADGAKIEAVIATDSGWLAVGSRDDQREAATWTSRDGLLWTAAPSGDGLRNHGGRVQMLGVTADGPGFVAVGDKDSVGNGDATTWTSPDGVTWLPGPDLPSFSGGGMAAVAALGGRVVAVGSVGWPDDHIARVWLSPPPGS